MSMNMCINYIANITIQFQIYQNKLLNFVQKLAFLFFWHFSFFRHLLAIFSLCQRAWRILSQIDKRIFFTSKSKPREHQKSIKKHKVSNTNAFHIQECQFNQCIKWRCFFGYFHCFSNYIACMCCNMSIGFL